MEEGEEKTNEPVSPAEEADKVFDTMLPSSPIIAEARAENDRRERLLKEEKALQERKEKLHAEQMVGGHTTIGNVEEPKEETAKEYSERVMGGDKR